MNKQDSSLSRLSNPWTLIGALLLIIFTIETVVMFLLPYLLPRIHHNLLNIMDSFLLALLSAPFVWWLVARPRLRQAEEVLRESERRYHSLFENMLEGYAYCRMIYDQNRPQDFVYLNVNGAFEKLTGLSDVVGKRVTEVIPGIREYHSELFEIYARVASTGKPEKFEIYLESLDAWLSVSVFSTERGCFVAVFDNITDRKRAEEELREGQARIIQQEKLASIGQLAAGVAHEINNPIGFIGSNLGTLAKYVGKYDQFIALMDAALRKECSDEALAEVAADRSRFKIGYISQDIRHLIEESIEGTERVKKIVLDLKTFSHSGRAVMIDADINKCLESTINVVWNEIKYVATLQRDYGEIPPVRCNPQQLNQVFLNLLVNAAHAIEKHGEITVRSWADESSVKVAVSDTGRGIPSEDHKRIFDAFYTTKEVGKGTGLGLSISAEIVKKHNGEIVVESEVGKGTTFTVRLPLADESRRQDDYLR